MALVQTPDGLNVWVPDNLAPPPSDPLMFGSTMGPKGMGPGPAPIPPPPPPPPAPMGIPPTTTLLPGSMGRGRGGAVNPSHIGQGLPGAGDETAGPSLDSVTGGALPTQDLGQGGAPVQSSPDYAAQMPAPTATPSPGAPAAPMGVEGQSQAATNQALGANADQQAIARAQSNVEGAEMKAQGGLEQEALGARDKVIAESNQDLAKMHAERDSKRKAVDSAVKAEADYKIDDNRRYKELGTGKTVGFWIMAALSGLGDALQHKSGPNMVIGMLQSAIEKDVDAQIRERDQLGKRIGIARNSLDQYKEMMGEWKDARSMKISEEMDRLASRSRILASQYGSDKAKLRGEAFASQLEGQAAAIRQTAADGSFDRDMKRQQMANAKGQLGLGWANLKLNKDQFAWTKELQADQLKLEAAKLGAGGDAKTAEQARELGIAAPPVSTMGEDGEVQVTRGGLLKNSDDSVYMAPTKDEAIALRTKIGAAHNLVTVMDEVRAIRDRVGGESKWGNSDDYQRLQVLKNNLIILKKAGTQGMSSDEDMNKLIASMGAADPTSFRAQSAGLDEGRNQIVSQLQSDMLHQYNYTGKPLDFPDPVGKTPGLSGEDAMFKNTLKRPDISPAAMATMAVDPAKKAALVKDQELGTNKAQRDEVAKWAEKAADPNASRSQRDVAFARLNAGAQQGQSPELRALYAEELRKLAGNASSTIKGSPESLEPTVR